MGVMAPVTFRIATAADLPTILALLADDAIARSRTGYVAEPTPSVCAAFDERADSPNNELVVGELAGEVIATLQLTYLPGLSRGSSTSHDPQGPSSTRRAAPAASPRRPARPEKCGVAADRRPPGWHHGSAVMERAHWSPAPAWGSGSG